MLEGLSVVFCFFSVPRTQLKFLHSLGDPKQLDLAEPVSVATLANSDEVYVSQSCGRCISVFSKSHPENPAARSLVYEEVDNPCGILLVPTNQLIADLLLLLSCLSLVTPRKV
jgi:hypothetical protein